MIDKICPMLSLNTMNAQPPVIKPLVDRIGDRQAVPCQGGKCAWFVFTDERQKAGACGITLIPMGISMAANILAGSTPTSDEVATQSKRAEVQNG